MLTYMVAINYDIPEELHRALKVLAAQRGTTVKALVIEALEQAVSDGTKEALRFSNSKEKKR